MEIKSITPKGDLTWYVKWFSSIVILIGMVLTSVMMTPINLYFHLVGVVGWYIVGFMWHDRALMILNSAAAMIFLMGIVNYHFGGTYP
jgi:hypothetical protein